MGLYLSEATREPPVKTRNHYSHLNVAISPTPTADLAWRSLMPVVLRLVLTSTSANERLLSVILGGFRRGKASFPDPRLG